MWRNHRLRMDYFPQTELHFRGNTDNSFISVILTFPGHSIPKNPNDLHTSKYLANVQKFIFEISNNRSAYYSNTMISNAFFTPQIIGRSSLHYIFTQILIIVFDFDLNNARSSPFNRGHSLSASSPPTHLHDTKRWWWLRPGQWTIDRSGGGQTDPLHKINM